MEPRFEWDSTKANANFEKHGVTFEEAATVFNDPLAAVMEDQDHSLAEHRYLILGTSYRGRLLVIAHVERSETIRLISARLARRSERLCYEQRSN